MSNFDEDHEKFMETLEWSIPYFHLNRAGQLILEELVTGRDVVSVEGVEQDPPSSPLWKDYERKDIEYGIRGLIKHNYMENDGEDSYRVTDRGRGYLRIRVERYLHKKKTFKKLSKDLKDVAVRLYAISSGRRDEDSTWNTFEILDNNHMSYLVSLVISEIWNPVFSAMDSKEQFSDGFMKELEDRRLELKEIRDRAIVDLYNEQGISYQEFIKMKKQGSEMTLDEFENTVKEHLTTLFTRVHRASRVP
jgi:hypothetical protein